MTLLERVAMALFEADAAPRDENWRSISLSDRRYWESLASAALAVRIVNGECDPWGFETYRQD